MASDLPAKDDPRPTGLDRRAVERVLARAAELQGLSSGDTNEEAIEESKLLEIAKEAGLSITSVRQALAEERTHIRNESDEDARWLVRVAGPAVVTASRVVTGEPEAMVAVLDNWMQREECLQVQRRFNDRVVWEARNDWVGAVKRGLRIGGRSYQLARARQVAATVVPVDEDRCLVRLDADLSPSRKTVVRAGGAVAGLGVATGATMIGIGEAAHLAAAILAIGSAFPVIIGGAGAYGLLRRHHSTSERTLLALEQVLDRLEYGEVRRPSNILDALTMPRALYR